MVVVAVVDCEHRGLDLCPCPDPDLDPTNHLYEAQRFHLFLLARVYLTERWLCGKIQHEALLVEHDRSCLALHRCWVGRRRTEVRERSLPSLGGQSSAVVSGHVEMAGIVKTWV